MHELVGRSSRLSFSIHHYDRPTKCVDANWTGLSRSSAGFTAPGRTSACQVRLMKEHAYAAVKTLKSGTGERERERVQILHGNEHICPAPLPLVLPSHNNADVVKIDSKREIENPCPFFCQRPVPPTYRVRAGCPTLKRR